MTAPRSFLAGVLAAATFAFLIHHRLVGMVVAGLLASLFVSVGVGRLLRDPDETRGQW